MTARGRTLLRAIGPIIAVSAACGPPPAPTIVPPARLSPDADFADAIPDEATWGALAAEPETEHFARTESVKFVIDRHDGRRLYFLQSERWDVHFQFIRRFLDTSWSEYGGMEFYTRTYRRPDRRFVVGSLVRYRDAGAWTLELISGDNLELEPLIEAFTQVRGRVFFGDALRYKPNSDLHERLIAGAGERLPVVHASELFGQLRYQPVNPGVAYGYLRVVGGRLDTSTVRPNQIVVTDEVPDDLPVVSALVTSRFQAPLAHVAILSRNRGTPDMALRDAHRDGVFTALDGALVRLEVGPQEFSVTRASPEEAHAAWEARRPRATFSPALSERDVGLPPTCELRVSDVDVAGAKAANLGELCGLTPPVEIPRGFSIPFRDYVAHLRHNGLDARIRAMLEDRAFQADMQVRAARLAALRAAIAEADIDYDLVRRVVAAIEELDAPGRVRFRSSTNAEDLPGFNGAGLYGGAVLPGRATPDEVADAIRQVWASVWNLSAFEERSWYRIDHERVAMSVLVQVSVDDGFAIGVAITQNPFDSRRPGVFVNVQTTAGSVTGARGDELPEQFLVFTYLPAREPEVISRSSRTGGAPILATADVLELTRRLEAIHALFRPHLPPPSNAVDVEFLVAGDDRRLVIVQARPYQVVWPDSG